MRRLISAALVATAMGLTLCGCEDKSSPSGTQTTQQAPTGATTPTPTTTPPKTTPTTTPPAAPPATGASPTTPPAVTPSTAPPPAPASGAASGAADVPATATTAMKDYLSSLTGITQKASAISSPADTATAMPDLKTLTTKLQDSWSKLDSLAPGTKDKLKSMFADQLKPATQAFEAQVKRISDMPGMSSVSDMLKSVKLFK